MWIKKKEWIDLTNRVSGLENEVATYKKCIKDNLNADAQVIEAIKAYRDEIKGLLVEINKSCKVGETNDTN